MNHLDTFSGIGSWALAAKWMGWNTLAFVEKEPFCQQVLKKNFNGIPIYDDIFTFSALPFRGRIDILTGSTPCQPFSQAGKQEGSNDERHLFPELLRVVAECKPEWIIIENVYGLLNIEGGQVFEAYNTSLEGQGYSVQTLCIPASALNAPHRRDRLWIVARSDSNRAVGERRDGHDSNIKWNSSTQIQERQNKQSGAELADRKDTDATDTRCEYGQSGRDDGMDANTTEWAYSKSNAKRRSDSSTDATNPVRNAEGSRQPGGINGQGQVEYGGTSECDAQHPHGFAIQGEWVERDGEESLGLRSRKNINWSKNWIEVATELCRVDDGSAVNLDGFKLTASKHRENRLKALGNGIIPQIALEIFRAIDSSRKAQ